MTIQSQEDLRAHLMDHIGFLTSSATGFDGGFEGEAKRMSVSVRVLCHDTTQSKSLLGLLGLKGMQFVDLAEPDMPGNMLSYMGMVAVNLRKEAGSSVWETKFMPMAQRQPRDCAFDQWWNAVVIDDRTGNRLSRRDIVLQIANKDGGAHVDPKLDAWYAGIRARPGFGMYYWTDAAPTPQPVPGRVERVSMRQIANEALLTLQRAGYAA